MTIGERIKERRKQLGLTVDELAERLGKNRATIYRYESNDIEKLPTTVLEPLAKALDVTPAYLMGWLKPSQAKSLTPTDIRANTKPVPLVGRVAAGLSCHAEDNIEGYILTDCELLHEGYDYFWLTVKGDSMEPELHDGDRVLVREQDTLETECYAVVRIDGEDGVVKRVRIDRDKITLTSVNPYYPPRVFEHEQMNDVAVVGKVIQSQRTY
ncbi:MAG: XRE family transcriptional regulator [Ruminococcus sp.]|nr:XRE family transcriptional regulator [Ruminococcus sp.]